MGIFSSIKIFAILGAVIAIGGAVFYLMNLKAELAVVKQNNVVLTESVETQKQVIETKNNEIAKIQGLNKKLSVNLRNIENDKEELRRRFNENLEGLKRDFGLKAKQETEKMTIVINQASDEVARCFELASGAPLEPGETNSECSELVAALRQLELEKKKRNEK